MTKTAKVQLFGRVTVIIRLTRRNTWPIQKRSEKSLEKYDLLHIGLLVNNPKLSPSIGTWFTLSKHLQIHWATGACPCGFGRTSHRGGEWNDGRSSLPGCKPRLSTRVQGEPSGRNRFRYLVFLTWKQKVPQSNAYFRSGFSALHGVHFGGAGGVLAICRFLSRTQSQSPPLLLEFHP